MKTNAKANDITKTLNAQAAQKAATEAKNKALAATEKAITFGTENAPNLDEAIKQARASLSARLETEKALAKIPKDRRQQAEQTVKIAEDVGKKAVKQGGIYSGNTSYAVTWGEKSFATTITRAGEPYSRSCTYRKTEAVHQVTLCPAGVVALVESEALRQASARDGLHLIDLREDGACVWVRVKNKALTSESGWIAGNGALCYHSTKSAEDARKGFERKLEAKNRMEKLEREAGKIERRARLIARLCGNVIATVEDAKKLGFCTPGIQAFQEQHGVGDTAPLPALVRSGNPAAIRLALSIARKVSSKKTLSL